MAGASRRPTRVNRPVPTHYYLVHCDKKELLPPLQLLPLLGREIGSSTTTMNSDIHDMSMSPRDHSMRIR